MEPNPVGRLPDPTMTAAELTDFVRDAFPNALRLYEITEVTDRGVRMTLPIGPENERPGGSVSGPTMMGLADAAAWMATLSRIGPVALAVTSNLTINFLRKPMLDSPLTAHAGLLKLGRRLSVAEVHLHSGSDDDLVAQATVTYAIPAGAT